MTEKVREQKARRKATQTEGKFRLRGRIRKRPEGRGEKSQRGEKEGRKEGRKAKDCKGGIRVNRRRKEMLVLTCCQYLPRKH